MAEPGSNEPVGGGTAARLRRRWHAWRWPVTVATVLVLAAILATVLIPGSNGRDLDPDSAAPGGSRAVAQILGRQGVVVSRATRGAELTSRTVPGSTLLVVDSELLSPDRLSALADTGADLVLVAPDAIALTRLAPQLRTAGLADATVRDPGPGCRSADALAAGRTVAGGALYAAAASDSSSAGAGNLALCYPDRDDPTAAAFASWTDGRRRVTVLGQPAVLTNDRLAEQGDAALALRTLGTNPSLIWYLPDPLDTGTTQLSLSDLYPRWVRWVGWQLVIAVLVALVWRARRLGALVGEPLPVVVRAAETPQGRARLYRASRARDRAAATLRTAAIRRLARRLDVPAEATPGDVVRLIAASTGRPEPDVAGLLLGPVPQDDATLVWLADRLDELEAALADPTARPHRSTHPSPQSREVP
jgi:hypothetical protein